MLSLARALTCRKDVICMREYSAFRWSYGVLLYEIFSSGTTPFADIETAADLLVFLDSQRRLKRPPQCSAEVYV